MLGLQVMRWPDRLAKRALTKDNVEVQVNVSKAEVKCIIWERKSIKGGKRGGKERRKEGTYTKSREMIKRIGWEGGIGEKRLC